MPSRFMSIKFLYQNPIGRTLTKEHLNSDDKLVRRAKDDPALAPNPQLAEYVYSIPNAIRFKGLLLQGYLVYAKVLRQLDQFEIRNDDIWLVTYPKSGTTWMEEILSLIFTDGPLDRTSKKLLAKRVPHLEVGKPLGHLKWLKSIRAPRLLATHLNRDCVPSQLRQAKAKIIYVVRNPKDNAVSYYHHHRMSTFLGNYSGTWSNFLELFRKGYLVYGDWFEHVAGYWQLAQQHPEQVLFVSYEELKVNLPSMIQLICEFVNRPLSVERIGQIAQLCTFEEMRNNTMVNREVLPVPDLFDMSQSKFMRKGIIGDWRNHFSKEESEHFDQLYADRLAQLGLDIAYSHEQAHTMMTQRGRIIRLKTERGSSESSDACSTSSAASSSSSAS